MPLRKEIKNNTSSNLISLNLYPPQFDFSPTMLFEKWAAVEVDSFDVVPERLTTFTMKGGLYAVFSYKGSSLDNDIFTFIYTRWLPDSTFTLDDRPHFEVLGEKYKNARPDSEEEIWIPVRPK